jgi:hypothetical protein
MSVCPVCEAENDPAAARCARCGEPLAQAPAEETEPATKPLEEVDPPTRPLEEAEPPTRSLEEAEPATRPLEPAAFAAESDPEGPTVPNPAPAPGNGPPSQGTYQVPPQGAHSPGSGPPPQPGQFSGQLPPQPGRPQLLVAGDVGPGAADGLLALVAGLVLALLAVVAVISLASSSVHGTFGDYVTLAVMLVGGALAVPSRITEQGGFPAPSGSALQSTSVTDIWAVAVVLTALVLGVVLVQSRRRERSTPSASLGQLAARALIPAVTVSVVLLVLALGTRSSSLFGYPASSSVESLNMSIGLEPGWTLLGPLLLTAAAATVGRLIAWVPRNASVPGLARARAALPGWGPAWQAFWLQLRVATALCGVGMWVFTVIETLNDPGDSGRAQAALALGSLLLIPNYGLMGMLVGFGATLGSGVGGLTGSIAGIGTSPGETPAGVGLFAQNRPWELWLLLLAVLIAVATPALLSRTFAVRTGPERFVPLSTLRAAAFGAVTGMLISLLFTIRISTSFLASGASASALSIGTGAVASALLGAFWFGAGYFLLSYRLGHRVLRPAPEQNAVPPYPYSYPAGYAQAPDQGTPYGYEHSAQAAQAAQAAGAAPAASQGSEPAP